MANDPRAYLENSFLGPILKTEGLTDLSYNGDSLFFATNKNGREKASIKPSPKEVGDLLRQLANLSERQFSFSSPILDVSFSRYRLNAVFSSLARKDNEKTFTFSLRLASRKSAIDSDPGFFGGNSKDLLLEAIGKKESIVIGGKTSSGKTELEKWLLGQLPPSSRVIVIDNVEELDLVSNPLIDLSTWLVNESIPSASFPSLVKNALRNNPDYIMVAEARGKEMLDAIVSAMSGHPIMTTIHAKAIEEMPRRMARLAMLSEEHLFEEDIIHDIVDHFPFFVYLEKDDSNGTIERYVKEIGHLSGTGMEKIYERSQA